MRNYQEISKKGLDILIETYIGDLIEDQSEIQWECHFCLG